MNDMDKLEASRDAWRALAQGLVTQQRARIMRDARLEDIARARITDAYALLDELGEAPQ